jgi:hypothetical protein
MRLLEARPARQAVAGGGTGEMVDEIDHFLRRGKASLKSDPQTAYKLFKVAHDLDPADGRAAEAVREAERAIQASLEKDGVKGDRIPELAVPLEEVTRQSISPQEGFVLSRINGQWDVKSIMKISPMKELDVLIIMQKLLHDGVIRLKKK